MRIQHTKFKSQVFKGTSISSNFEYAFASNRFSS